MAQNIVIIGGGRLGSAIAGGLILSGQAPDRIMVLEPYPSPELINLRLRLNPDLLALSDQDVIILAVKPDKAEAVLQQYQGLIPKNTICFSVMAGIEMMTLRALWPQARWGRVMPTIGVKTAEGVAGYYADDPAVIAAIEAVFSYIAKLYKMGLETELHAVTALCGSGPAYFYAFTEAMARAGIEIGLSPDLALDMARDTFVSAARLANHYDQSLESLRQSVTSPKGTTEAGLNRLMPPLDSLLHQTLTAAYDRSLSLGQN